MTDHCACRVLRERIEYLAEAWAESWSEPLRAGALELRAALDGDTSIPIRWLDPDTDGLEFLDQGGDR